MRLYQYLYHLCLVIMGTCVAYASTPEITNTLKITDAWIRPAVKGRNTALYLKIVNESDQDTALVSAISTVARTIELHTTIDDHGVMKMRPLKEIICPAGQTTELKPGAMHIMLIGLTRDLKMDNNNTVPISLIFDDGQELVANAPVKTGTNCCGCHE